MSAADCPERIVLPALPGFSPASNQAGEDSHQTLRERLADIYGVESSQLLLVCGRASADDLVARARSNTPGLQLIDESWIEFPGEDSRMEAACTRPGLITLRTPVHAYAMAGLSFMVLIAGRDTIAGLEACLTEPVLPALISQTALAILAPTNMPLHAARLRTFLAERDRLAGRLETLPQICRVCRPAGPGLILAVQDTGAMKTALRKSGISCRETEEGILVQPGSAEMNDVLYVALGGVADRPRPARTGECIRNTSETRISVRTELDSKAETIIDTGIGFFDHMLEQIARHGDFALVLSAEGDLEIDAHHTVEDCALALGEALKLALGDRAGIGRYGFVLPMDEASATISIDLSGRPALRFDGDFPVEQVGEFQTEMVRHFFASLATGLGAAIHIEVQGENAHHMIESVFKGVGRALRPALAVTGDAIPSTKGVL